MSHLPNPDFRQIRSFQKPTSPLNESKAGSYSAGDIEFRFKCLLQSYPFSVDVVSSSRRI